MERTEVDAAAARESAETRAGELERALGEAEAETAALRAAAEASTSTEKREESEQSQQLKRLKDSLEAAKEIILSKEGELAAVEQIRQERDVLAEMVRTLQEREASRPDPKQEIRDGLKRAGEKFKGLFAKPPN